MTGPVSKPLFAAPGVTVGLQRILGTSAERAFAFVDTMPNVSVQALDLGDHQYLFPQEISSYSCYAGVPAAAGANSIATLRNTSTKKILRVRRLTIQTALASTFFWGTLTPIAAAIAVINNISPNVATRDSRNVNTTSGAARTPLGAPVWGTSLAAPQIGEGVTLGAAGIYSLDPLITIAPGGWAYVMSATANQAFNCGMVWDERQATTGEVVGL